MIIVGADRATRTSPAARVAGPGHGAARRRPARMGAGGRGCTGHPAHCCSATERKDVCNNAGANLEDVMLGGINQTEEDKYWTTSPITWNFKSSDSQKQPMVVAERGGVGRGEMLVKDGSVRHDDRT